MNVHQQSPKSTIFSLGAVLILLASLASCGQHAGTTPHVTTFTRGNVTDWTTRHVKFSNPGSEADSIRAGKHAQWLRIMNDPRYQMQQRMRSRSAIVRLPGERFRLRPAPIFNVSSMHRDWAFPITPAGGIAEDMTFPAKYGFDVNAEPTCSDFVVFGVNRNGSSTQANIVGFNNLYNGTCPSSAGFGQPFAPSVKFAYNVDTGFVPGSPVLSEDGTRVAFITYTGYATTFHVVTLGTTGSNGTAYNAPVTPCTVDGVQSCTTNNAVDTSITFSIGIDDAAYPVPSPFVDYSGDIAYFADALGSLHKITGVFRGTPSEVTTGGWPFTITGDTLSSPVYDSVSQHMFITGYQGYLYCIDVSSGTAAFCNPSGKVSIGSSGLVWDGPILDSTAQTVFAEAIYYNESGGINGSTLTQINTNLGNVVQASMGSGIIHLYSGDFDNTYYNGNYASGYMYFCGSSASHNATLYRIGFSSSGTMNSANDGNSYQLSDNGECTPLTEAYNSNQGKDYLFLGVDQATGPSGCGGQGCVLSFVLGSQFPTVPAATLPLGLYYTTFSGVVVDNVSTASGASQIYFTNYYSGSATQASQNGLN